MLIRPRVTFRVPLQESYAKSGPGKNQVTWSMEPYRFLGYWCIAGKIRDFVPWKGKLCLVLYMIIHMLVVGKKKVSCINIMK